MAGAIDGLAQAGDAAGNAGRGLVVHHHHRLDAMIAVGGELGFERGGIDAMAPVARHEIDLEPVPLGHHLPQIGEMPGLERQHAVARRQRVENGRFPRPGARRGIHQHRARAAQQAFEPGDHVAGERRELRSAVVDDGMVDGPEDAVRNVGWTGNLQEMSAAAGGHIAILLGWDVGQCARKEAPAATPACVWAGTGRWHFQQ